MSLRNGNDFALKNNKYRSTEFFRFFFIMMICVWHFSDKVKVLYHGYLGVEFFFILSGMLIYKSFRSHPEIDAIDNFTKKFLRYFPKYIISLIPIFVLVNYQWVKVLDFETVFDILLRFFSESLIIQNVGFFPGGSNYPLWYLSVLLFGGSIIYSFLRVNRSWSLGVIFPLFIILGYTYLFSDHNNNIERWGNLNGISLPFMRGLVDICLGVLLMAIISLKKSQMIRNIKLIDILSVISFCGVVLLSFLKPSHDQYSLLFFSIILTACFIEGSFYNRIFIHNIWDKLGSLSYDIFLIHALVIKCFAHSIMNYLSNPYAIVICYLFTVIVCAIIFRKICSDCLHL